MQKVARDTKKKKHDLLDNVSADTLDWNTVFARNCQLQKIISEGRKIKFCPYHCNTSQSKFTSFAVNKSPYQHIDYAKLQGKVAYLSVLGKKELGTPVIGYYTNKYAFHDTLW